MNNLTLDLFVSLFKFFHLYTFIFLLVKVKWQHQSFIAPQHNLKSVWCTWMLISRCWNFTGIILTLLTWSPGFRSISDNPTPVRNPVGQVGGLSSSRHCVLYYQKFTPRLLKPKDLLNPCLHLYVTFSEMIEILKSVNFKVFIL